MANMKHGSIREMVIDKCLSDKKKKYGTMDMLKACNRVLAAEGLPKITALNTIRNDMDAIEARWGAAGGKIVATKTGKNVYYHYASDRFSIYNTGLTHDELKQLNLTLDQLKRFAEHPKYEWLDQVHARLKSGFMSETQANRAISFDNSGLPGGNLYVTPLLTSILKHEVLNLTFKPYHADATVTHVFHPYHLKEYNHRWFLFGWDEETNGIAHMGLDEIENMEVIEKDYIKNTFVDFSTYFNSVIGVTVDPNKPVVPVKLWVNKEQYPFIACQPLHDSQQELEHWDDGSHVIQIEVQENEELEQTLLTFGEKVVVMEPQSLKQKMQGHIWVSGERYAKY